MTLPGSYEPRREPLGQPATPVDQPISPYPPTAPLPAMYPPVSSSPPVMYMQTPPQRPTSAYATLSLVFGILGLVTSCCSFGVFSAAAVILGHVALHETKTGQRGGHGNAVAGLVLGYIIVVPAIVLSIMLVFGGIANDFSPTPASTP